MRQYSNNLVQIHSFEMASRWYAMMNRLRQKTHVGVVVVLTAIAVISTGCAPEAHFTVNAVLIQKNEDLTDDRTEYSEQRKADIANVLIGLFGTPDDPHVPNVSGISNEQLDTILDARKIKFAAGRVGSDERGRATGLYRKHCAHCHGVTGDGAGPTSSFLNPYPRDYRMGIFKFKSTPKGKAPTHEDLKRILVNGIPGTAMPSFLVLPNNEIEALIHYVRYLSVRGQVERRLIDHAYEDLNPAFHDSAEQLEPEDRLMDLMDPDSQEAISRIGEFVGEITQRWLDAEASVTEVVPPDPDRDLAKSIDHGRELFYGYGGCIKCHGESALGDGQTTDYDDWTNELEPSKPELVAKYEKLGALTPRNILPRNLRLGVYRGGRRPVDIYWRLKQGIDGTPMPFVPMAGAKGLSEADLWSLIDYVRNLPYESISNPRMAKPKPVNERERS
jgi:mono/diheme cytochrome c family protein